MLARSPAIRCINPSPAGVSVHTIPFDVSGLLLLLIAYENNRTVFLQPENRHMDLLAVFFLKHSVRTKDCTQFTVILIHEYVESVLNRFCI